MKFVGRVLPRAFRLLRDAPLDLLLVVVALYLVGAFLALDPSLGLLSLLPDFAAGALLTSGLLGRSAPDGARASIARLGPRLPSLLGQVLLVLLMLIPVSLVAAVVAFVLVVLAAPGLGVSLEDLAAADPFNPSPAVQRMSPLFLAALGLVVLPFFGRLMPSQAIVIDQHVGPAESIRRSWRITRRRTLATALLGLIGFVAGFAVYSIVPPATATFLAILPAATFVAVGVAVYDELQGDRVTASISVP